MAKLDITVHEDSQCAKYLSNFISVYRGVGNSISVAEIIDTLNDGFTRGSYFPKKERRLHIPYLGYLYIRDDKIYEGRMFLWKFMRSDRPPGSIGEPVDIEWYLDSNQHSDTEPIQ